MSSNPAWLAKPLETTAVVAAEFNGNATEAVWLPNERIARLWMQYVTDTKVIDTTPPPAPTDVAVAGSVITWNATADLESGIAEFIIERDGQPIATISGGKNRYGRPIFQGLQYSDTPLNPLVPLRYEDNDQSAGTQHAYRIITVNTAGLKSKPSASAANGATPRDEK